METKKKSGKNVAVKKKPATEQRIHVIKEAMTKSSMASAIAEETGLTRKNVTTVFDALTKIINGHLREGGVDTCTVLGLMRIEVKRVPATKRRVGVNPFTGRTITFDAVPAHAAVNIKPLKALQDMAGLQKAKVKITYG